MNIFNKRNEKRDIKQLQQQFKLITGYTPAFSTYQGGLYEMELICSCVESFANHCSKLNPIVCFNNKTKAKNLKDIENTLQRYPNGIMTAQQFLSKTATILKTENNCLLIPIYENTTSDKIVGIFPISANGSSIVEYENNYYIRYRIGIHMHAIEYEKIGHLRTHYYKHDFFGESNESLRPTIQLIDTQNQGIVEGIKQSAHIRFLARMANVMKPKDLETERERLTKDNLSASNNGGVMIFDNRYADIQSINNVPFIVDDKQANFIKNNVFNYFHTNEDIVQNKADENVYNAYYEGEIEAFGIQLGQVLTNMYFKEKEILKGIHICLEASKIQFASNTTKFNVSTGLFDRGILTTNQVNDIWNLAHVEDGDKRYIRREYAEVKNLENPLEGVSVDESSKSGASQSTV